MPNLPMHIYLAHQVAEELGWGYLQDHRGSCLLGSTAPDIRAMTSWDRERTHFAPLSVQEAGTGTRRMFELYPQLADPRKQSAQTRAFVLGYVSHLTADEAWITSMFHTNFGERNRIADTEVEAHIWDRAIQLDMDRRVFTELDGLGNAVAVLPESEMGVAIEFLEQAVLQEWRVWVTQFLGWDFTWDRLKRAMNRMYRDNDEVQQIVDAFLQRMPESLERVYQQIPQWDVKAYQQRVVSETISQVREYLGAA
ncbi:MAG TPA: zinc dependent phospholipase C family protein [Dehalococcoidia bacterium]|nr:zinc dependent phospholipase C family protein [Dehalococcoidia bacterium]